ncbi:hypothetical protein BC832DRAFT_568746 [Gaertneriomyces semiglobifer]|nr:hypothetical protein BC832DRAFT_568746 [Gaertneriomyces semiglobifer]
MSTPTLLHFLRSYPLPTLPLSHQHSGRSTTTPAWPRTDMTNMEQWDDFTSVIMANREAFDLIPFQPTSYAPLQNPITGEEDIHYFADSVLHTILSDVLRALGHSGYRIMNIGGNGTVVGDPDRILRHVDEATPLCTVEYKTPWGFKKVNDLATAYQMARPTSSLRKAVDQTYGYITFNDHRFGVLSTYEHTYILRRKFSDEGGCLQVAGPISRTQTAPFTLLEAYTSLLLLCMTDGFCISPTSSPYPSVAGTPVPSRPSTLTRSYQLEDLEIAAISFKKGRDRSRVGAVFEATFNGYAVICKLLDASKNMDLAAELNDEVGQYRNLEALQGKSIPQFLAYLRLWNMLHILVVEDCGISVQTLVDCHERVPTEFYESCQACLRAVHHQGFVHGDVKLGNFVASAAGEVRIVDLGMTRLGTEAEMLEESRLLEELFRDLEVCN